MTEIPIAGVLLAAGEGRRFGAGKLLAKLNSGPRRGVPVGVAAFRTLACAIPGATVVLRSQDLALRALFEREGANVVIARDAAEGVARSLAAGVERVGAHCGMVVALADMPWIERATISAVARAIALGASIAAPRFGGQRGHPVGFAPGHRAALLDLRGDQGARAIIAAHRELLTLIDVDDPGVLRDVDTPDDLRDEGSSNDDEAPHR